MTRTNGIERMTYAELVALRDRIEEAMATARANERAALKAKIAAIASAAGYTVAEVLGASKRTAATKVRYRNPADPSQTWSGMGRRPLWLIKRMAKGEDIESMRCR